MSSPSSDIVLFSSAARTATANGADTKNDYAKGVVLFLDITAASGTSPTLAVKLQSKDDLSGAYVDVPGVSFATKTGTGSSSLTLYPGIAETANISVSGILSRDFRAVATIGGTSPSFTFSLNAELIG